ncbi:hypothetical protein VTO42DRAFT_8527 [Malbranchea cinnamomea]
MASQNGIGVSSALNGAPGALTDSSKDQNGVKVEDDGDISMISPTQPTEDWESERRLVSALAMLQEMEAKIHQLRTLLPERLLAPLRPIVTQGKDENLPSSPQELYESLSQAARDGVAEVEAFKSAWNRPEMKAIWDHVDKKLKERPNDIPCPSGVWANDYDAVLRKLDEDEARQRAQAQFENEQSERKRLAAVEGGWQAIIESCRPSAPGLTINILASTDDTARFSVLLHSTSTLFLVQNSDLKHMGDWVVSMSSHGSLSKTIEGIFNCIDNRDRKWDLPYLLGMLSSYANVKKKPCIGCNRLLDSEAQLPTVRKPRLLKFSDAKSTFEWDPYHPRCA